MEIFEDWMQDEQLSADEKRAAMLQRWSDENERKARAPEKYEMGGRYKLVKDAYKGAFLVPADDE